MPGPVARITRSDHIDVGFNTKNVLALSFDLSLQGYSSSQSRLFYHHVTERGSFAWNPIGNPGLPGSARRAGVQTGFLREWDKTVYGPFYDVVWPNYFRTLEIPLLRGRDFTLADDERSPRVVIASEAAAKQLWPGEDPIGKRLREVDDPKESYLEVVAVARDIKRGDLTEKPAPYLYLPYLQRPRPLQTLLVRTTGDPSALISALEREDRLDSICHSGC